MPQRRERTYSKEVEVCDAFIEHVKAGDLVLAKDFIPHQKRGDVHTKWTIYPETANYDILLVHNATGAQLGLEAKLVGNLHVLEQATEWMDHPIGPDFRGVIVGRCQHSFRVVARRLGLMVFDMSTDPRDWYHGREEFRKAKCYYPEKRCRLPIVPPDVKAGVPSPITLSSWDESYIRAQILCKKRTVLSTQCFKAANTPTPSRLREMGLVERSNKRGFWMPTGNHTEPRRWPDAYAEYERTWDEWCPPEIDAPPLVLTDGMGDLFDPTTPQGEG